jgi:DNA anti-recombination protein RmuC
MLDGLKRRVRPKAAEKLDNLVGPLYVREDHLRTVVDELTRLLADRFDAEAEENAIFGARITALADAIASLQEEVRQLRADLDDRGQRRSRPAS